MMEFLEDYEIVQDYLPSTEREIERINRQHIVNLSYSLIGADFENWVKKQVVERNEKVINKKQAFCKLDSEVAEALKNSTCVAEGRGVAWSYLKVNKVSHLKFLSFSP